jgi:mannose-6-phosphate isomerase-like protein (cupin superfamily)
MSTRSTAFGVQPDVPCGEIPMVTRSRIDATTAESEFGMACQRLLPWAGECEEPPFGVMACFLPAASSTEPDCHDQVEMMIVISGAGLLDVAGDRAPIGAGDVLRIDRNRRHVVENTSDGSLVWVSCYWPLREPPRPVLDAPGSTA